MQKHIDSEKMVSAPETEYHKNGFYLVPRLLPESLVQRARAGVDAVLSGQYETGIPPAPYKGGNDPKKLQKIDQAHLSNRALFEAASHPNIGRWAARITGRPWIQLWAVQLLFKPPGGTAAGNVGWHQDLQYWKYWEEDSELFTAWLALSDVTLEAGAMKFAIGSHEWGLLGDGDFFDSAQGIPQSIPAGEIWTEAPGILQPGGVSFHHCLTYHGSGPNISQSPRVSLALHLRTDRSRPKAGATDSYVSHLDDPRICPIIFDETKQGEIPCAFQA